MQRDNIRAGIKFIKADVLCDLAAGVVRKKIIGQHIHAERLGDAPLRLPDAAKADDTDRLALQFDKGIVPVAPVGVVRPITGVHALAVMTDMVADLQQQRNRELADRRRAVGRHVHDGDALFAGIVVIDHVVARSQNGNELNVRALVDRFARDGCLVHHHDFRITDALGDQRRLRVGRAVIGRHAAELFQLTPAQITGIFRISVQYYNFHVCSLLSTSYLRLPHYSIIDIQLCMAQRFNISLRKSCLCRV